MPVRKVFISHGKADAWIASQLARCAQACGVDTFLDEADVPKGGNFKKAIHDELAECEELLALFTPWSAGRFWVWTEVGAASGQDKRVVAVLHGLTVAELEAIGGSKGAFEDLNIVGLNSVDDYFAEPEQRVKGDRNA